MKKILITLMLLGTLTACSSEKEPTIESDSLSQEKTEEVAENSEKSETKEEVIVDEKTVEESPTNQKKEENNNKKLYATDPESIGETFEEDGIKFTVKKAGSVDNSFSTGPINFNITGISIGDLTITDEEVVAFTGEFTNKPSIIISANVENTEDKKVNFYIGQSKLTTNTQEQIDPNILLSDASGDYLGQVKKEIIIFYHPESNIDEISELKMYVSSPSDGEDYSQLGDELVLTFKFDEEGKLTSID